jgi:hypothetical protein
MITYVGWNGFFTQVSWKYSYTLGVERNDYLTRRVLILSLNKWVDIFLLPGWGFDSLTQHVSRNNYLTRMGFNSLTQQVGRNDSPTRMIF